MRSGRRTLSNTVDGGIKLPDANEERHIHVGAARLQLHIQPGLVIKPGSFRLKKTAMPGFGKPINPKPDLFRGE